MMQLVNSQFLGAILQSSMKCSFNFFLWFLGNF